jgi:Helix-turn-helix domain
VDAITIEAVRTMLREELARVQSPWLDSDAAAAYLGTAAGTLKTWRATGKGPRYHIVQHRLVRYHRDELDEFVRSGGG